MVGLTFYFPQVKKKLTGGIYIILLCDIPDHSGTSWVEFGCLIPDTGSSLPSPGKRTRMRSEIFEYYLLLFFSKYFIKVFFGAHMGRHVIIGRFVADFCFLLILLFILSVFALLNLFVCAFFSNFYFIFI